MAFDDEIYHVAAAQLHSSAHYTRQSADKNREHAKTEDVTDKADTLTTIRAISARFGRIKGMLRA